ncbi:HTH domain-containing protein [Acetobacterium sp. UBA5834]|uniref:HTH domain-containing protein n=1 Tax=Acetobacterium sp. UBA5834 TaxID=1945907 RepID=UPI00257F7F08|nr:HTH domain-containing protein [Acetobacterium sp. UBA5834]
MDKKTITAKALSDHFEVSKRPIDRDLAILSQTEILIYTARARVGESGFCWSLF